MQNRFKPKYIYFFLIVLLLIVDFALIKTHISGLKESSLKENQELFEKSQNLVKTTSSYLKSKLDSILENQYFIKYIDDNTNKDYVDELFISTIKQNINMFQLRYLDETGQEIIRVDKKNDSVKLVKGNELQNKFHRDYFTNSINLSTNKTWFSNLDLNIENKKIEVPFVPTLRIVKTLIDSNGNKKGILIANINYEKILNNIISLNERKNIYLIDGDGYTLVSSNQLNNWNRYTKKNKLNFQQLYYKSFSKKIDFYNTQDLILLIEDKKEIIQDSIFSYVTKVFALSLFLLFLLFIIVYKYNSNLAEKEILKQENIIIHQSKLAQIGDILSMIAHQWRQPLNALSMNKSVLLYIIKNEPDNQEYLEKTAKNIDEILLQLSGTIDNFKDFYANENEKVDFYVSYVIKNTLKLIETIIKDKQININLKVDENIKLNSYRNQLQQVFLAILNNSIEAIKNNKEKKIDIKVFKNKNNIQIEICDNGIGIPKEIQDKVFEPYFTTTSEKNASGLGLYMSKTIVEKSLNGQIDLSSNENGTTIKIIL